MASLELGQVVTGASALAAKGEAGMAIAACQGWLALAPTHPMRR